MEKLISLRQIAERAYKREEYSRSAQFTEEIYKKYRGYFNELAEALEVKAELPLLKRNKIYQFKEYEARLLEELLHRYRNSMKSKDNRNSTKNMEKELIKSDQYNAFLPKDIWERYEDMAAANGLIIMAIECFYQLFLSVGLKKEKVDEIMSKADRKYSYSKRVFFQGTMEQFSWYIKELDEVNKQRHDIVTLTERENAIWLKYANKEIGKTLHKMINIRERMKEIVKDEVANACFERYKNLTKEEVNESVRRTELLRQDCVRDNEIKRILKRYEEMTGKTLNFSELLRFVVVCDEENEDETVVQLLLSEVLGIQVDGNLKLNIGHVLEIKKMILLLYQIVKKEKSKYSWPQVFCDKSGRLSDRELLEEAVNLVEIEYED